MPYLVRFKHASIRIRTEEQDFSSTLALPYEWEESVYDKAQEILSQDTPEPKGKCISEISNHDANLCHNVIAGRSVTGIIHLTNKTLIDWHGKK